MNDWLVCGTRKKMKGYLELVCKTLDECTRRGHPAYATEPNSIIEGCCPDSADEYAESWAMLHDVRLQHHPSTSGNYLKRNIEMVSKCDLVIAFFDGWSYGTAHTIAQGLLQGKKVIVIKLAKEDLNK